MSDDSMEQIIERVGDLPAMPEVVAQVLDLAEDPDSDMEEVSHTIERDPGLAARILRVSNSAYFGMRQHVGTLKLAMVILGVREIRNIVLGVSLFDNLRDAQSDRILQDKFWSESFRVASLSKSLGMAAALGCQGEDFIAGLLHGIGKMVLLRHLGNPYAEIIRASENDDELIARERAWLDFSHADAAAALGYKWNLPEPLCDAIWLHVPHPERPLAVAKDPRLAAVVRIGYYAGRDVSGGAQSCVVAALSQTEAWDALDARDGDLGPGARAATLLAMVEALIENPPMDFS